jgi:hypothetical protein
LNTIGKGKEEGQWRQDFNHSVELYLPWGLAFVAGGNHSIASGILTREGEISVETVYDVSSLYDMYNTDGEGFYSKNGEVIAKGCSLWLAAIFEVAKGFSNKDPEYLWERCWHY